MATFAPSPIPSLGGLGSAARFWLLTQARTGRGQRDEFSSMVDISVESLLKTVNCRSAIRICCCISLYEFFVIAFCILLIK